MHHRGLRVRSRISRHLAYCSGRDSLDIRIVVLDFVLSNLDCEYLETEAEKVPFFESNFNLSRDILPSKPYTSKLSRDSSIRFFVDRFPIFLRPASASKPRLTFTYMDAGAATIQGFGTHLHAYWELLRRLPAFAFIYVAPTGRFFGAAGAEFSRSVLGRLNSSTNDQLLRYFRLRKTWEAGDRVPAADVVFLNAAKRDFDCEEIESQYRKWNDGTIQDVDVSHRAVPEKLKVHATFLTQKSGSSLSVFHRSAYGLGKSSAGISSGGVSPGFSPEGIPA